MVLLWAEGLSHQDIAEVMRLPLGETRRRIENARSVIARYLLATNDFTRPAIEDYQIEPACA